MLSLPGGRHRAGLEVGPINQALTAPAEVGRLEHGLLELAWAVDFPLHVLAQLRPLDLTDQVRAIRERAAALPETSRSRAYAREMAGELDRLTRVQSVRVQRRFVVVGVDQGGDFPTPEEAIGELERRLALVASRLRRAGLRTAPVSTEALLGVMHAGLNKDRSAVKRIADAERYGHLAPYARGAFPVVVADPMTGLGFAEVAVPVEELGSGGGGAAARDAAG